MTLFHKNNNNNNDKAVESFAHADLLGKDVIELTQC